MLAAECETEWLERNKLCTSRSKWITGYFSKATMQSVFCREGWGHRSWKVWHWMVKRGVPQGQSKYYTAYSEEQCRCRVCAVVSFFLFKVTFLNHKEFIYTSTCNYSLNAPEKRLSTSTSLHKVLLCLLRHPALIKYSSAKKKQKTTK